MNKKRWNIYALIAILFFLAASNFLFSQNNNKIDLDYIIKNYPERTKRLFDSLNLEFKGLEKTKKHVEKKQYKKACLSLLDYYAQTHGEDLFEMPNKNDEAYIIKRANQILEDTFSFQNFTARQLRTENGNIDWNYLGPRNDIQWGNFLNRHFHLKTLLNAFLLTGLPEYAKTLNNHLIDWFISNPMPDSLAYTVLWRPLNAGLRPKTWPGVFYLMQKSECFTDACKILMLQSIIDHKDYLKKYHWKHHNHAVMEMVGLNSLATFWPEFKNSEKTYQYALNQMLEELEYEVLPDGAQNELSFTYHYVALISFVDFATIAEKGKRKLPDSYVSKLEAMYNYIAYTLRPDGRSPLCGDTDLRNYKEIILKAATKYKRPDWEWIVTNGSQGTEPEKGPTVTFPYAGHVIARNSWEKNAHWSFFDAGPAGASHKHADKLHVSVSAFGNDFLVDAGIYWYKYDIWRQYFLSSHSHNVVTVDDKNQNLDVPQYDSPNEFYLKSYDSYMVASDTHDKGYVGIDDHVEHTRALIYVYDKFWLVIDNIFTDKAHNIKTLWHFHPSNELEIVGNNIISKNTDANMLIVPIGDSQGEIQIIKGQIKHIDSTKYDAWSIIDINDFPLQGWYSPRYNELEEAPVAVFSENIHSEKLNAWLFLPNKDEKMSQIKTELHKKEGGFWDITVKLNNSFYIFEVNLKENIFRYAEK